MPAHEPNPLPCPAYPPFGYPMPANQQGDKPILIIGNKNYSSWSLRAWLTLHSFGIEFEEMPIRLFHTSNQPILQRHTPLGKVPVLLHQDNCIWDSLAIALYAERHLGQGITMWGDHPAIAMSVVCEMHSGFLALRNEMPMNVRAVRRIEPSQACMEDIIRFEAIVKEGRKKTLQACQSQSPSQPYLLGAFSLADVFFAPVVFRLMTYAEASGVTLQSITLDYLQAMHAHPSMVVWREQALQETDVVEKDEAGMPVIAS